MSTVITKTTYETERNKPMPNRLHGVIQTNLSFLLKTHYNDKYQAASEVSLATTPKSTPDICIFPKKVLHRKGVLAKETEAPLTTIEIQSPSQSIEILESKIWELYFPMGVQSAWIIIPALKAVKILFPDDRELIFHTGNVKDESTDIELSLTGIFEDIS